MRIKTWQQRCEEHPDHNGIVSDGMIQARMQEEIDELRAAIEQAHDWNEVEALRASLREHMAEIHRLRAVIEQPEPDARAHHKMMVAMMREHWQKIHPQWKDDPELCHALGYEAGYNDAVARRVEPRSGGSGAGFESLPASPHKMTEKNT